MNFFEHQDRARRNTWRLIGLFALSVVLIVLTVNLVAHLFVFQFFQYVHSHQTAAVPRYHVYVTLGTCITIGLVSAYRIYQLKGGGDRIAAELGGEWVDPESTDPVLRRLVNVVEEISLASGVPMPFIYVMEKEHHINALAVGYSFEDAVVMISRGALTHLTRDELQGVVAHEFTHILNGDMRLNIRMMGVLFGILGISYLGRALMRGSLRPNRRNNGGGIVTLGAAIWIVGYIGVFFGRLIRAGVSRQREFLADASAVRFTRNPDGIAGALKKISEMKDGGHVQMVRREEVSHMFFTAGQRFWTRMMATHPPLIDRIRAIKPDFEPSWRTPSANPDATAEKYVRPGVSAFSAGAQPVAASGSGASAPPVAAVDAFTTALVNDPDCPDPRHLNAAIRTLRLMPDVLLNAARCHDQVEALFPALFVSRETGFRDRRMLYVWDVLGDVKGSQVKRLRIWTDRLAPGHTLPLADLAFPVLKRLPEKNRVRMVNLMEGLAGMGKEKDSLFEYCFVNLLKKRLQDMKTPAAVSGPGKAQAHLREALTTVFAVLAVHGHLSGSLAKRAFDKGIRQVLPTTPPSFVRPQNWMAELDQSLNILSRLNFKSKEKLLAALLTTAAADGVLYLEETELLRTLCACLGVPVPLVLASTLPISIHQAV